ncbi:MAG: ATP-binding protein [Candidatus Woesearchaeota archaeon]
MDIEQFNNWWFEKKINKELVLDFKRDIYYELKNSLNNKFILAIVGLRRVGKTTILYQLIDYLIKKQTPTKNILFFSFDEYIKEFSEVLNKYKELHNLDFRKEKIYLFLDEIQKCPNWENELKKTYDLYPKIKIIISGSESLFIRKRNKETLAGRLFEFNVKSLSFKEYLSIKGIKKENFKYETIINPILLEYIEKGAFPETINLNEKQYYEYIKSLLLDKIIYKDIPHSYNITDAQFLNTLLELIAYNPGMYIDYYSLSKQYNKDRRTIKQYLEYLEKSFLIKIITNYRKGSSSLRKLKRVYLTDNALIKVFKRKIEPDFKGKMVENLCINHFNAKHFWKNSKEVDLIHENIPIEIKYREQTRNEDFKAVLAFMKKFKIKKEIKITKNIDKEIIKDEKKINLISLRRLLLK